MNKGTKGTVVLFLTSRNAKEKLRRTAASSCCNACLRRGSQWVQLLLHWKPMWYLCLLRTMKQQRHAWIYFPPFFQATVELSEEKRVSGSKVIPMVKMLMSYFFYNTAARQQSNWNWTMCHQCKTHLRAQRAKLHWPSLHCWIQDLNPQASTIKDKHRQR